MISIQQILKAITDERNWHINDKSDKQPSEEYRNGFLAGMNQARYIVEQFQLQELAEYDDLDIVAQFYCG